MNTKKITIKDIAQMAGVSTAAVSFVINNKEGVSPQTREKVLEIIKTTNFIPNKNSQRLSLKKSFNICLAMNPTASPFEDFFYFEIAKGITEQCGKANYNLLLTHLKRTNSGFEMPDAITNGDADGIIFLQDTHSSILNGVSKLKIPYVLVDTHANDDTSVTINPDNEKAAYAATKYLIRNGHTQIGYLGSNYLPGYFTQTYSGYMQAMEEYSLSINPSWTYSKVNTHQEAYNCMEQILLKKDIPTAMLCTGDIYAIWAMRAAWELDFKLPEQISFISLDNTILCEFAHPPLTSVSFNAYNMGISAVNALLEYFKGEVPKSVAVKSDTVIERKSVKKLNGKP